MEPLKKADFVDGPTLSTLFGHVETLYRVNGELLRELKEGDVAAAFLRLAPYFKLYSVYAYDYKQVLATLQVTKLDCSGKGVLLKSEQECTLCMYTVYI